MDQGNTRTALVTGASSGLGFEASVQLAEAGYRRVIVTARTAEKAASTQKRLEERTGKNVFETLILDNDRLDTVEAAASGLEGSDPIDTLILNAGIAPPRELQMTVDGFDAVVSSSLIGHHLFTMRLLEDDLLTADASIVIAGSEAARGDVPMFKPIDFDQFAEKHFDGDREAAIASYFRMEPPSEYKSGDVYATAKQFSVWWANELASRLPNGMTVNTVSPGSTPGTDVMRDIPFMMRYVMVPIFKVIPGMSHSIQDGAGRYLEIAHRDDGVTGAFFASAPKKMTGPLTEIELDHFDRPESQSALWTVLAEVTGADYMAREAMPRLGSG